MRQIEIRQLEYFHSVCKLNSISKAAAELHVTQPSISIAIQKLEEELGVQLLDRSQRQIALTDEGRIFFRCVNDILMRIGDSVNEVKDFKPCQGGSIKIGIPPMIGVFLFPHIFAKFREQYPEIELVAVEAGSLSIPKLLEEGKIDIGIITKASSSLVLETQPITMAQLHVCLPHSHPLNNFTSIPFAKLSGQPFILLKEDTYNYQIVMNECQKHHFTPQIIFSSSQIGTIINLVEMGVGITFLFDAIARKYPAIKSLPLEEPITSPIFLTWNRKRYLTSASRAFIDFISSIHLNLE